MCIYLLQVSHLESPWTNNGCANMLIVILYSFLLLIVSAANLQSEDQVTPAHAHVLNMQLTLLYLVTQVCSSNQVRMR